MHKLTFTAVLLISIFCANISYAQRTSLYANPYGVAGDPYLQPAGTAQGDSLAAPTPPPIMPQNSPNIVELPSNPAVMRPPQQMAALQASGQAVAGNSWIYNPPPPLRRLQLHDVVNIRVDETAQTSSVASAQARKNASLDMKLSDWVRLSGLDTVKPATQSDGDQKIAGQDNEVYRANSTLQTREALTFNIAAEIVDIRPNGLLVLSARKTSKINDNVWELSLGGLCRPEDVKADNTILSRDIIELSIEKNERGQVRDGYSRGWVTSLFARFKPF